MSMATKLGPVVTFHDGLQPIKSYDPLITWSFKITCQDNYISTTRVSMATKLDKIVTCHCLGRSRDKLN